MITPREVEYTFSLLFDDRTISILAYNLETVLAEKLETVLSRNIANTRLIDVLNDSLIERCVDPSAPDGSSKVYFLIHRNPVFCRSHAIAQHAM